MKIQKKEEFLQKKTTVTYVGLQVVALTKILLGLSVDTGKCSDGVNIIIVITIVKDIKV